MEYDLQGCRTQAVAAEGRVVNDADVTRLSPLGHKHINMMGGYSFSMPESVAGDELRALRDPNDDPAYLYFLFHCSLTARNHLFRAWRIEHRCGHQRPVPGERRRRLVQPCPRHRIGYNNL